MKFCINCGADIDDDCTTCPKCGRSVNKEDDHGKANRLSSNQKLDSSQLPNNENTNLEENSKKGIPDSNTPLGAAIFVFRVISSIAIAVGGILLMLGGYKEYEFRATYDLKDLSEAGINLARKYSNYSDSISLMTIGGICLGVGLFLCIALALYQKTNEGS